MKGEHYFRMLDQAFASLSHHKFVRVTPVAATTSINQAFLPENVAEAWAWKFGHDKAPCVVTASQELDGLWRIPCQACGVYGRFTDAGLLPILSDFASRSKKVQPCVCPMNHGGIAHTETCEDRPSRSR